MGEVQAVGLDGHLGQLAHDWMIWILYVWVGEWSGFQTLDEAFRNPVVIEL